MEKMSKEKVTKTTLFPGATICHDDKDEGCIIEVELPRAKKEDMDLSVWSRDFCVDGGKVDVMCTGPTPYTVKSRLMK